VKSLPELEPELEPVQVPELELVQVQVHAVEAGN
jgi:hypothetical protein